MSEWNKCNLSCLAPVVASFELPLDDLRDLMFETSAVLFGGAVTQYLNNTLNPDELVGAPDGSDLDFLVFSPRVSKGGHQRRAFQNMVIRRFEQTLKPLGFNYSLRAFSGDESYSAARHQFETQAGIVIQVHWFIHQDGKRYMNLVFTDTDVVTVYQKTDIPIGQAIIVGTRSEFCCESNRVVLQDLREKKLTPPDPKYAGDMTPARVKKYCDRFHLTVRL
jgi:hypothetical protein